jgi:hypothetical protein
VRGLFRIEIQGNQLRVLLNTAKLNLSAAQLSELGTAIRDSGARVQARAVRNVSGYPVQYDGKVFRVVVRTGTLKGAIDMQWPYQSPLQARVYVNGTHTAQPIQMGGQLLRPRPVSTYAASIEYGHEEIDLKRFMQGKTVPFFASRSANSTGPFAARGLTPAAGPGDLWESTTLNAKLLRGGKKHMVFQRRVAAAYDGAKKGAGTYYIAFRKVGKKGWIIPAARARPFMRAAVRQSERDTRQLVRDQLVNVLSNATHRAHR